LPIAQKRSYGAFRPSALWPDVRWKPDRHIDRNHTGLFRRGENLRKPGQDTNPTFAAVCANERRDPSGPAAVHPGQPLRRHGAFEIPSNRENWCMSRSRLEVIAFESISDLCNLNTDSRSPS